MIKLTRFISLVTIIAGVSLMTLSSCNKKDKTEDITAVKSYRLKSLSYYNGTDSYTTSITYDALNRISLISEKHFTVEIHREEWKWAADGNEVTITESYLDEGNWITSEDYIIMTYFDRKPVAAHYYSGDTSYNPNPLQSSLVFYWHGDQIYTEIHKEIVYDSLVPVSSVKYEYQNYLLISATYFNKGLYNNKRVIEYLNDQPVEMKKYDDFDELQETSEFFYTGKNISRVQNYHVIDGIKGEIACIEDREYNANNCATKMTSSCTGEQSVIIRQATYEEGEGNFNDYILINDSWINVYLFPESFPSEFVLSSELEF